MSKINDGGCAFPFEGGTNNGYSPAPGMTLRDWFAGQALPAVLCRLYQIADRDGRTFENVYAVAASASQEVADAMLAAREGETP